MTGNNITMPLQCDCTNIISSRLKTTENWRDTILTFLDEDPKFREIAGPSYPSTKQQSWSLSFMFKGLIYSVPYFLLLHPWKTTTSREWNSMTNKTTKNMEWTTFCIKVLLIKLWGTLLSIMMYTELI